jgi:hypothetical protein
MDDTNTTVQMPAEPAASNATLWYVVGGVAVLAALGLWYFSSQNPAEQMPASDDTSAAAINAELDQLPDDSDLDADAAASAQAVQGF